MAKIKCSLKAKPLWWNAANTGVREGGYEYVKDFNPITGKFKRKKTRKFILTLRKEYGRTVRTQYFSSHEAAKKAGWKMILRS